MSLKEAARQTLALLEAGRYTTASGATVDIVEPQARAVAGTRLYTPQTLATWREPAEETGLLGARVDVTDETTQQACQRLAGERVVALNFASARNPGGGFLNGAKAQEEDLCRCSGLYPTLLPQRGYYDANRATPSLLYTDHAIYSPGVPFFRVRARDSLLPAPFLVHVITAPAPNAGPLLQRDPAAGPAIAEAFRRRWANVLAIARANGHRALVLGAWGCGAFGNDPRVAARAFLRAWPAQAAAFDEVVFAIPNTGSRSAENHRAFRELLRP